MTADSARSVVAYADTNLFVALFATEEHPSHESALRLFRRVVEGSLRLLVTPMIVADLAYVAASALAWDRPTITERLSAMLEADGLVVREAPTLLRALTLYRDVRRLDFADAYVAASAIELGPAVIASFDADFDRIAGVTRIRE